MLKLEYDKKEIEGVIDKIVKKTMNMDLTWDWPVPPVERRKVGSQSWISK